jgi:hypothetical protein
LQKLPLGAIRRFCIFSAISRAISCWRFRLSSIGFLDTFDPFDSSRAALPENFLQLPLLSLVSVLVCDLPLEKSAIA